MGVLHVWAIFAGLLTIGLPIAIHFLTRPKPVRVPLSTIRFLQQALNQKKSRNRLRDFLILGLRTLAVGLLALAFARPLLNQGPINDFDSQASVNRIVILDVSQSMAAIDEGVPLIERARVTASNFLQGYQTSANLILAGARPSPIFDRPSRNLNALKEALVDANAKPERIDVNAALESAGEMLQGLDESVTRELIIVSDFQRTNWAAANFSTIPEGCEIQFHSVASDEQIDNLAITDVRFAERASVGDEVILKVDVANFSREPQNIKCAVELGERSFVLQQTCPPNTTTTLVKNTQWQTPGWKLGKAILTENTDAVREDDSFPIALQVDSTSEIKLISRSRSRSDLDSSFYIERGLNPFNEATPGQPLVDRLQTGRLDGQSIGGAQLLIFDHPGKLEPAQIELMASVVRRGRSILYFAGELLDANNLKLLYEELGSDLQAPVDFLPPDNSFQRKNLSIAAVNQDGPPFSIFGDAIEASINDLRFSGGLDSRNTADSVEEEVLARLSDQSALMFVSKVAAGNLCIVNADLNRSTLTGHLAFVPLLNELVSHLLDTTGQREAAFCGESLTRVLPIDSKYSEQIIFQPNEMAGGLRGSGEGTVWSTPVAVGPIVTTVSHNEELLYAVATTIPPEESDLRVLDGETLTTRLASGKTTRFQSGSQDMSSTDFGWVWAGVAVLILMILEVVCLTWFKT